MQGLAGATSQISEGRLHGDPRGGRRLHAWLLLGVACVAFAARGSSWPVARGTGALITSADAYYHLRRIEHAHANFPHLLERDLYVNFPVGGEVPWPPAFDWSLAALARSFVSVGDRASLEGFLIWVPPILGTLCAVGIAALGTRLFSRTAGVVAGLVFAIAPAAVHHGRVGFVDHEPAVGLITLLAFGLAASLVRIPAGRPRCLRAVGLGVLGGFALLTWAGSLLFLAVLQLCALVWMLCAHARADARARAILLVVAHALAAAVVSPFGLGREWTYYGAWSPIVLSNFQPVWLGGCALGCLVLMGLWRGDRLGATRVARATGAIAFAVAALGAALVLIPGLGSALVYGAGWFQHNEPILSIVGETQPLLVQWPKPERKLSLFFYTLPFALAWTARRAAREQRADLVLLVAWTGCFGVATFAQVRFVNQFAPAFALVSGALVSAGIQAAGRWFGAVALRSVSSAVAGAAVIVALAPVLPSFRDTPSLWRAWCRGERLPASPSQVVDLRFYEAAAWLGDHSPPTAGWLDGAAPEYGLLGPWGEGHLIRYAARRPLVQDNFGPYASREGWALAERYFSAHSESEALAALAPSRVRYVFASALGSNQGVSRDRHSLAERLHTDRGLASQDASPLERHRLVYEVPARGDWRRVEIFEVVAGATLLGQSAANARVEASLTLRRAGLRRPLLYRAQAFADSDGRFAFRVPYSTGQRGDVSTGGAYTITSRGAIAHVRVSELAIQTGARIDVPEFASTSQ